jgi:hypothetical protein
LPQMEINFVLKYDAELILASDHHHFQKFPFFECDVILG